jgi:pyridoxamine 5'-phosphate oxidase
MGDNPIERFHRLFEGAAEVCTEPDAMVLATVDPDGRPSARFVLLKAFDQRGFVFYTNLRSRKARALAVHPQASLCFYWAPIGKQVRIEGVTQSVADQEADDYFRTRPRESQLGAWASDQSAPLQSRAALEERLTALRARFDGRPIPRPPFWSGFRVVPDAIEFWTRDPARLHVRERFDRIGGAWRQTLLFP